MDPEISIEVACALPARQHLVRLRVPAGCTATEALERSGIKALFPEIDWPSVGLGIFGRALERPQQHALEEGDRLEIYRPLTQDPRAARRARAKGSRSGSGSGGGRGG